MVTISDSTGHQARTPTQDLPTRWLRLVEEMGEAMGEGDTNGWHEYKRLLLFQLEEQAAAITEAAAKLQALETSVARLQVRAGIWGATAGLIPVVAALVWRLI